MATSEEEPGNASISVRALHIRDKINHSRTSGDAATSIDRLILHYIQRNPSSFGEEDEPWSRAEGEPFNERVRVD